MDDTDALPPDPTPNFKRIGDAIRPLIELHKSRTAVYQRMIEGMRPLLEIQQSLASVVQRMQPVLAQINKDGLSEVIASVSQVVRDMPMRIRKRVLALVQHGWFLDPDMGVDQVNALSQAIEDGELAEAETWLLGYYKERADAIEAELAEAFPKRATVLSSAFRALRRGDHALSVPVFLLQADGICQECTGGRQLFSKGDRRGIRKLIEALPENSVDRAYLEVFTQDHDLVRNTDNLPPDFHGLNRHKVLHGLDTTYGTEINSYRALSLLNYAAWALKECIGQNSPQT